MGTWSRDRPRLEGEVPNFKGGGDNVLSWSLDLSKLNSKCHINYSELFVTKHSIMYHYVLGKYKFPNHMSNQARETI